MAIAKTSGAFDITDNYGCGGSDINVKVVDLCTYSTTQEWAPDNNGKFYGVVGVQSSVTTTDTVDLTVTSIVPSKFSQERFISGALSASSEWSFDGGADDGAVDGPSKTVVPSIGLNAPRVTMASFEVEATIDSNPFTYVNVHGFYFEEGSNEEVRGFEFFGVHDESSFPVATDAVTMFDANQPCDAYLLKKCIAGNANTIGRNTVTTISFPLVGVGSGI